ncbi:MAG: hypothetical protein A2X45_24250 [Lentisphaerae bacterium GWF2_50_93]|nr:MAG: hypothetical protein A2X45_24250 [Lentisphaerae bacterium GWF2_50_93]
MKKSVLYALSSALLLCSACFNPAMNRDKPIDTPLPCQTAKSSSAPVTEGLVAEYLFDSDARDSGPFQISGTVHNAQLTTDRFGRQSQAYQFDGSNAYIEIPDNNAFSVSTTRQLSISVWMRPDALDFNLSENNYVHWMGKGSVRGSHEWTFRMYNKSDASRSNRTSFYLYNLPGGLGAGSYAQDQVSAGQWIHFVCVADLSTDSITLYKNGVKRDSDAIYNSQYHITPQNGSSPVRIGTRDFKSYFQGAIDDIRVYNRAMSAEEVLALYNEK